MRRIAVIGSILENPRETQTSFNEVVASFKGIVKGRMGTPFDDEDISVISLTVLAEAEDIDVLTGSLENIPGIAVKTAISVKELEGGR